MKIAAAQIDTTVGDIDGNLAKIRAFLTRAQEAGAQLAVFPEAVLTGYPAWDLWEDRSFIQANLDALEALAKTVGDTACIVGFIDFNKGKTGKNLLNGAALLHKGKIVARRYKTLLPTYDVFDEARYFHTAEDNAPVEFGGKKLGITICEDVWNVGDDKHKLYKNDPVRKLMQSGLDLMVNLSASPYNAGKPQLRRNLIGGQAKDYKTPFIYCNAAGGNDDLVFDGNSMVFDAGGNLIARAKSFEEDLLLCDMAAEHKPLELARHSEAAEITDALVLGIRDYAAKTGFKKAVLGLSGGIDSAVVCALAAKALGPENVTGISMPSPYTSQDSKDDAAGLAKNLGVNFYEIPITPAMQAMTAMLAPVFAGRKADTTEENIQSRLRGNILMAVTNKFNAILLNTGNKSELATGYCTMYGDMCGALAVLSDLTKERVYAVARHFNLNGEVIPQRSITRAPSAELRPGQKDQDELPPYEILDRIVSVYVEEGKTAEEIAALGFDEQLVRRHLNKIDRNEFKRRQAPPGLKITPKAFGTGRRMPIARGTHRK